VIRTSCFKKSKDEAHTVSIARSDFPWPMKGYGFEKYPPLLPSLNLLKEWRAGKISKEVYTQRYYQETLSKLDPQKVYNDLDGTILLCHELPGEFCHRRLVAKWFESSLDVEVVEL